MPESAKIPVTFTVPDLNLDKIYDGKPINIDEENLKTSCSYSAYGKEGAGDITIVHKKDGKTLSSAPSNCGKYSLVISAESSRFYQGNTKIFDYEIKELPKKLILRMKNCRIKLIFHTSNQTIIIKQMKHKVK